MKKRRRSTPAFKAQVVLEVLSDVQSPAEVCRKHALSPDLLATWKAAFLGTAHTLFQGDEQRDEDQARIAELEQLLGRATRPIEVNKPSPDISFELRVYSWRDGLTPCRLWVSTVQTLLGARPPL